MRSRGQNDLFQKILLPVRFHGLDNSEDSLSHGYSLHLSYRPYGCYGAYGSNGAYRCHRPYRRYGSDGCNGAYGCNGPDGGY